MSITAYIILSTFISREDYISVFMVIIILLVFLLSWGVNRLTLLRIRKGASMSKEISNIIQQTLNISNNYVVKLNIRERHAINLHGNLLPEEGLGYQEGFDYIHPDDRDIYREFVIRLTKGGYTTDECTFRWDMSGKKHLGEWRYMHDQGVVEFANRGSKMPTNMFFTLTDVTEQIEQEKKEKEMSNKYRLMFEQSIVGLAFYDQDGKLLTANQKMREILKFQSEEDPYYYDNTIYDLPTFRNLLNNKHIEDLYFCTKSVIIERGVNCYTEMRVHPIYDNQQELHYITFSIRDVTQERELYLQNRKNDLEIRQANEDILQYETELQYLMDLCDMRFFRVSLEDKTCTFYKSMGQPESKMTIKEVITHFVDSPFRQGLEEYETYFNVPRTDLTHMRPFFHEGEELQWNFIDSVPSFDENGKMTGTYGVVRNVSNLIEKQERLKEETERAKESGLKKSTFMANMTHEIRTPLNAIVGFSDVLPMLSTTEEKQEIIRVIMNNCDMLLRLVNDILAVSALDNSGIEIKPAKLDFAKAFNDMAISLEQRVQAPGVQFIAENPYDSFITILDSGRMQQIFTNFVTNAVKYTTKGHIKIGYQREERKGVQGIYLYCEDTGAGIPKDAQSKIFDRFVKLNDYVQGTGLGLSICKAITDSCHGDIGVDSMGDGQGSTFWAWIPCDEIKE